jgi:hypothetical protein
MTTLKNIKEVVEINSNIFSSCKYCTENIFATDPGDSRIADRINHYLRHGFKILHIGSQTNDGPDGKPWHSTVAVLGR